MAASEGPFPSESFPGVNGGTMLLVKELVVAKGRPYYYWYAYQRVDHRLFKVYVGQGIGGRLAPSVVRKGRDRLREKISKYDPC